MFGRDGRDTLLGGEGDDELTGGDGSVLLDGGDGNDSLVAQGSGKDTLIGGAGNDNINAYTGTDGKLLDGGAGQDTLYGGIDSDTLLGGDGADLLTGGDGSDLLDGGEGDDVLVDQDSGNDTLVGGAGNDYINAYTGTDRKLLDGGAGQDSLYGGIGSDTLLGGDGNDYLNGGGGNDSLLGGDGNDDLYGEGGNDSLFGGSGKDNLYGGNGNDSYKIASEFAHIRDSGGDDAAVVSASFVKVPSTIETVTYVDGAIPLPYWISALLPDDASGSWYRNLLGNELAFNYSFPTVIPAYDGNPVHADGYEPFGDVQKGQAEAVFSYISTITSLAFRLVDDAASINTIAIALNNQPSSDGYAVGPMDEFSGSDVFFSDASNNESFSAGTYAALTLVHEIGHAIGLKHPFNGPDALGNVASAPYLQGSEDNTRWTVMSYNSSPDTYQARFGLLDIAALQYLYGPNLAERAGNDIYLPSSSDANFVWDGAGIDTIDATNSSERVTVFLAPGYWGFLGDGRASEITAPGQITVNFGSVIENAIGSKYGDYIIGNDIGNAIDGGDGNDSLVGGAGNDTLNGGAGTDTVAFSGALTSYLVGWNASESMFTLYSAADGLDTVIDVETLQFAGISYQASELAVNINHAPVGAVSIAGAAIQNQSLVAANTLIDVDGLGAIQYQWYADGAPITGATTDTLVLRQAQVGKTITVTASYTDGFGAAEHCTSAATAAVANVNDAPVLAHALADQLANAGTALAFTPPSNTFSDVDGDILAWTARLTGGAALPSWLAFDPVTHAFSGTPTSDAVGVLSLHVTAADSGGLSASDDFNLTVGQQVPPIMGTAANDSLTGGTGADLILGLVGNDTLTGLGGNDTIDGGAGALDESDYLGARSAYTAKLQDSGDIVITGPEGTDTLRGVERAVFADVALGFDVSGTGGEAYRLYKAAFDRLPDDGGLGFWMYYLDRGFDFNTAADAFLNSDEFRAMYGPNPTNNQFVGLLYQHVLQRLPDQAGYDFWNAAMTNEGGNYGHAWSKGEVLVLFSESTENKANVVGQIQDGFEYQPYAP